MHDKSRCGKSPKKKKVGVELSGIFLIDSLPINYQVVYHQNIIFYVIFSTLVMKKGDKENNSISLEGLLFFFLLQENWTFVIWLSETVTRSSSKAFLVILFPPHKNMSLAG